MGAAAIPHNEKLRLQVLQSLNVLDTPIEERFERITRMLASIFDVPISGLSFVDKDRHWLKSVQGSDVVELPREFSFCAHAILGDDVLVIEDILADPKFADNPLLEAGHGVRFYAGAPLMVADNIRVGTLCLLDVKPRQLNESDLTLLKDFSTTAVNELLARAGFNPEAKLA
ncbi:MAG: GAF domain-containing protein [Pseudomonadales bacterium]|nr:MAG: GAF domain-containing protein [Pseudomonadales bacterium]